MIISGGSRRGAKWFAGHLMRNDGGQLVRLAEARGLAGYDIPFWFRQMEAVSFGTRCDNYFYHANLNPREEERLTEAQWEQAIDTLEHNLGLDGHARFVVEHEKNDRVHRHVFWSRIDPETMTAVSDSKTYAIHMQTADSLEKEFGHEPTPRGRGPEGPNPKNHEVFRGQESGIDPYDVKAVATTLWRQADSGQAFAAALEEHGLILARGDRRDFVIIDQAGDDYSLARYIGGVRAADVRARMAGVDRAALPSVEEARKMARDREDAEPAGSSPVTQSTTAPSQEHGPSPLTELAQELPQVAKEVEPQHEPIEADRTAFDRLAENLVREAEEAALVQGDSVLERSVFERIALERKQAWREAGGSDDSLMTAGLDWLANKTGAQRLGRLSTNREPTEFERMAEETKQAMRDNGGQPYTGDETSFWQRGRALLASARDRFVAWVKGSWQDLVGRFTRDRNNGHDDPGLER